MNLGNDLIENINDIAGLRIVCTSEKAVYEIAKENKEVYGKLTTISKIVNGKKVVYKEDYSKMK